MAPDELKWKIQFAQKTLLVVVVPAVKALKGRKFTSIKTAVSANKQSYEKNCMMKTQFVVVFS